MENYRHHRSPCPSSRKAAQRR